MKPKRYVYYAAAFLITLGIIWGAYKLNEQHTDEQARKILAMSGMKFYEGSLENAFVKAEKEQKTIMLHFYAAWCNVCRKMKIETFGNARANIFYNKNFIAMAFNIEKEGKELAKKYEVEAFPTLVFINSKGNVIQKVTGFKNVDDFLDLGKKIVQTQK